MTINGPAPTILAMFLNAAIDQQADRFREEHGRPPGPPEFASLKARRLGMDVPISLALILASAISLFETFKGGEHAYFDAAVSLLFLLLIAGIPVYVVVTRRKDRLQLGRPG